MTGMYSNSIVPNNIIGSMGTTEDDKTNTSEKEALRKYRHNFKRCRDDGGSGECSIGKRLRQKCIKSQQSLHRRNPPFKIKAHKVPLFHEICSFNNKNSFWD